MCVLDLTLFLTSSFPKPQWDEQIVFCFFTLSFLADCFILFLFLPLVIYFTHAADFKVLRSMFVSGSLQCVTTAVLVTCTLVGC